VGIEDLPDLLADLDRALAAAREAAPREAAPQPRAVAVEAVPA